MAVAFRAAQAGLLRLAPPRPWLTFLITISVVGTFALMRGVVVTPDSAIYDYWGGRLVDSGFDFAGVYREASSRFPPLLYAGFVTLVALLKALFGEGWAAALVVLNVAATSALGVLLVRLVERATSSGLAAWFCLLFFIGCFDIPQWVPTVLSDSTFGLLAFVIFALAARNILETGRRWGRVIVLALAGVFYRPTGLVLLPDLVWAAYLSRRERPPQHPRVLLIGLCGLILVGTLLFAWLMQDPSRWPFESLAGVFRDVSVDYRLGEVVNGRPDTFHAPPAGLLDLLLISGARFLSFFSPVAADFSLPHQAAQLCFFLPCYALAGWLLIGLWRGDTAFDPARRKLFLAAAGAVLAYAVFHGLIQVDFDWRYRLPILPHLILLAGGGLADLERRWLRT